MKPMSTISSSSTPGNLDLGVCMQDNRLCSKMFFATQNNSSTKSFVQGVQPKVEEEQKPGAAKRFSGQTVESESLSHKIAPDFPPPWVSEFSFEFLGGSG
eukprot:864787-Amphidinium_carterae.1